MHSRYHLPAMRHNRKAKGPLVSRTSRSKARLIIFIDVLLRFFFILPHCHRVMQKAFVRALLGGSEVLLR